MKIFAISDLHLSTVAKKPMDIFGKGWENHIDYIIDDWQQKVGEEDIVLLAGDLSWAMRMEEALPDIALIAPLKGKKVILRGNHDYWWNTISQVRNNLPTNMYALQNDVLRFENLLICGTRGWLCPDGDNLPEDDKKIFLRECERLKLSLSAMSQQRRPNDKVIAMMHYPPFNGKYDCSAFVELFIKYNVDTVVYGHLHGKDCRANILVNKFNIRFFLTSCDIVQNKLVLIDEI